MKFLKLMNRFNREEDGATAIEYGLFAALIAAVIVTAVAGIGEKVNAGFEAVEEALPAVPTT
ncbi:Flp family type IVb pilin [Celeribacter halophilus]|uniref:Flp family type IVb pilin n=1 Tax=Celeribacter halophilus TaxID=576117 RepID=UPI001C08DC05|nr:Flp family type IVb pilin [Celeribacter halophilus]MBU2889879.1 Flp family type IVb pilin [Celeribacter halophilus]MDO6512227.1 Flp family type IVb pilin [Celeribacter halophilus]